MRIIVFGWNPGFEVSLCTILKKGFGNVVLLNSKICIGEAVFLATLLITQATEAISHKCLHSFGKVQRYQGSRQNTWMLIPDLLDKLFTLAAPFRLSENMTRRSDDPYVLASSIILSGILNSPLPPTVCPRSFAHYS